jgi:hypothetical protein
MEYTAPKRGTDLFFDDDENENGDRIIFGLGFASALRVARVGKINLSPLIGTSNGGKLEEQDRNDGSRFAEKRLLSGHADRCPARPLVLYVVPLFAL